MLRSVMTMAVAGSTMRLVVAVIWNEVVAPPLMSVIASPVMVVAVPVMEIVAR